MVYAVISDISFSSGTDTGSVSLINKGEIPLPKNVSNYNALGFYDETYFSDRAEAKTNFDLVVNKWRSNGAHVTTPRVDA